VDEAFHRRLIGGINALEHEDCASCAAVGKPVTCLDQLSLKGRSGEISEEPTSEPCLELTRCRPREQQLFAEELPNLTVCGIQGTGTTTGGIAAHLDDLQVARGRRQRARSDHHRVSA
jgi:hypothetical protein